MFRILSMSYQDRAYPIPSPEVKLFLSGPEQLLLPGELLMYICLTKPQNTRKQNGITALHRTFPEQCAWTLDRVEMSKERRTSFCARPGPRAGTLQVYYLKTTRSCVRTGTGIRHLVLDAVPSAAGAGD